MNDKDRDFVDLLKNRLSSTITATNYFSDFELLKWLQENKYNVDATASLLRHYWRVLNSYDFSKQPRFHEIMDKYYPQSFIDIPGRNNDGDHFVYIDPLGTLDGDGMLKSVSQGNITLNRMYKSEMIVTAMRNHERSTGRRIDQIYIYDLAECKVSVHEVTILIGPYLLLIKTLLKFYPAYSKKIILINLPNFSNIIYNAFKPLLSEKMRKKIIILGKNWKREILDHIDHDVLPVHYGGNLVDENNDPKCQNKIVFGTKVPCHLYWTPSKSYPNLDELTVLTVRAGACQFITFEIDDIGAILEWFYNSDSDWGFGVFYTKDEQDSDIERMDMVYPQIDHFSGPNRVMENDRIVCMKAGYYKIWFDNSFSWFSKVHISYKINVIGRPKNV